MEKKTYKLRFLFYNHWELSIVRKAIYPKKASKMFSKSCCLYKINDHPPTIDKKKYSTNNTLVPNTKPTSKETKFITVRG